MFLNLSLQCFCHLRVKQSVAINQSFQADDGLIINISGRRFAAVSNYFKLSVLTHTSRS